jgi:hypothetical protein
MTKWREDRMYEIMQDINNDIKLKDLYEKEIQKSTSRYPRTEFYDRMERCYEKAKTKLNNENL